ncbi:MAG TPA: hypothetical protein PKW33_04245 [Anaerolineaceae bacterium]|nr:hypothetical protein [Anaerolineaceae bacterium]HPN50773.1 hypothetical protein [Anaerolineaceae bacterium]
MMTRVHVQILSYRASYRILIRRTLQSALQQIQREMPEAELFIEDVGDVAEILKYTPVLAMPCMLMDGRPVCMGRFPKKEETCLWLKTALEAKGSLE